MGLLGVAGTVAAVLPTVGRIAEGEDR